MCILCMCVLTDHPFGDPRSKDVPAQDLDYLSDIMGDHMDAAASRVLEDKMLDDALEQTGL